MRRNFISALLVTFAFAAPLWAWQQHVSSGTGQRRGPAPLYVPRSTAPHNPAARTASPRTSFAAQPRGARTAQAQAPRAPQPQASAVPHAAPPVNQPPRQIIRGQGPHNGDWLRNTMQLPPNEQQRRLEQDQHFRQLPPQRQEQLRNRLQTFNSMPPQQRQRVLNRMEMMEHLRPEQQRQAVQLFGQFQGMAPERKQMMRQTLRQMRGMPPDARERLLTSPEARSRYSPQELQMLRGFNDIGFVGPE